MTRTPRRDIPVITFALGVVVGVVCGAALPAHADGSRCDEAKALAPHAAE